MLIITSFSHEKAGTRLSREYIMISIARREAITRMGMYAGTALLSGCAVNPVTGKREFMLMSEAQEIEMGNEAHGQIVAEYGSYVDSSMQDWFNEKGQEMAAITHRKHLTHHFTVLDSPVINAFAVPGGFVYVTRGILGYFNDEAQFAGVLAHELGHVNARHTAARYSKAKLANFGLAVGSIFSEEFAKYSQFVSLGTTLLFLKFSRNDERQADKLGVEYSSAVSYDAVHMSDFFKTLERLRPEGGSLPSWQSTHPDPGDRINATRKMALAYQNNHPDMTFVAKKRRVSRTNKRTCFRRRSETGICQGCGILPSGNEISIPRSAGMGYHQPANRGPLVAAKTGCAFDLYARTGD